MKSNLVTSVKKLTTKRVLVYIDYEPAFALYIGELKRFGIKEDEYIEEGVHKEIIEVLSKRATVRAMNLLKTKDYARAELVKKLESGYYPKESINAAFDYIDKFGYIDDCRYVSNYISFKSTTKSRKQIVLALQEKGIDKGLIQQACDEFYESSQEKDVELDIILRQLEKKISKFATKEITYEDKQKILSYFYRKGFSVDKTRKALDIVVDKYYND